MLEQLFSYFTEENLTEFFQSYRAFGPFVAVLLPFIEALLPFLPLLVFVVANVNSFGLWQGFLLTWVGASLGSIAVFLFIRHFGQQKALGFIRRHPSVKKLMIWVKTGLRSAVSPALLSIHAFGGGKCCGRTFASQPAAFFIGGALRQVAMIFMVSFVGHDLKALFTQPLRTAAVIIVMLILWYAGKRVEHRLNVRFSQREKD